jgi:acetyltransferase-like isoleucine patch superfamily enzyme
MKRPFSKYEIYGFWGMLYLAIYLIRTKLLSYKARLIRFPIEIRGKKYIDFGVGLTTGKGCRIEAFPYFTKNLIIEFGDNVEINDYVHIAGVESIKIGNNVLIASKVYISDIQHGRYSGNSVHDNPNSHPAERTLSSNSIVIEDNVWIGESVSVLDGVIIGKGTIVGANSVVSKSLPQNIIAVGSPAKPIKKFNFETQKWEKI